jgi:hypothetical protein
MIQVFSPNRADQPDQPLHACVLPGTPRRGDNFFHSQGLDTTAKIGENWYRDIAASPRDRSCDIFCQRVDSLDHSMLVDLCEEPFIRN